MRKTKTKKMTKIETGKKRKKLEKDKDSGKNNDEKKCEIKRTKQNGREKGKIRIKITNKGQGANEKAGSEKQRSAPRVHRKQQTVGETKRKIAVVSHSIIPKASTKRDQTHSKSWSDLRMCATPGRTHVYGHKREKRRKKKTSANNHLFPPTHPRCNPPNHPPTQPRY